MARLIVEADGSGKYNLPAVSHASVSRVDVVDIDILIKTQDGQEYLLPRAGIQAMGENPPPVVFSDQKVGSEQLLSQVSTRLNDVGKLTSLSVSSATDLGSKTGDANAAAAAAALQKAKAQLDALHRELKVQHQHAEQKEHKAHEEGKQEAEAHAKVAAVNEQANASVEQMIEKAQKITENLHTSDHPFVRPEEFHPPGVTPPPPGVPAPISLTPVVTLFMGNVVGSTSSVSGGITTILGGGGASSTGAAAQIGPRTPQQFSVATVTGTSGDDIIYAEGAVGGNGAAASTLYAKEFALNVAGYFTSLQDIIISGVPSGVTVTGATHNTDGTWTLPSATVLAQQTFTLVYDATAATSTGSFDVTFDVRGDSTRHVEFHSSQTVRFQFTDVTDSSQITSTSLLYSSNGVLKEVYTLPTGDQPNSIDGSSGNDTIYGGRNADTINGGDGNNLVYGREGNDTITLGNGANTVDGGTGNNNIHTGTGNDSIAAGAGDDTIVAGDGINTVDGGAGNNNITSGSGADTITVAAGNDTIVAGEGNNTITAGVGNHSITVGTGADSITAGDGINTVIDTGGANFIVLGTTAANGASTVITGSGNDSIVAVAGGGSVDADAGNNSIAVGLIGGGNYVVTTLGGDDTILSGAGNDTISAGDGTNVVSAGAGSNVITTGSGDDSITVTTGNDTITAGDGANTITAGAGNHSISVGINNDTITLGDGINTLLDTGGVNTITIGTSAANGTSNLTTGSGNDTITISAGGGTIYADAGANHITAGLVGGGDYSITTLGGNDTITSGAGNDTISAGDGANVISAGAGNNYVVTGSGNDAITVGNGNNTISGGLGTNTITGGTGSNTLDYSVITSTAITVSLAAGTASGTSLNDNFTNISNVIGNNSGDTITGNGSVNILTGGTGNDSITGGGGNDTIYGGAGNDTLTGGSGHEYIYGGSGNNTITGGTAGTADANGYTDHLYGGSGNNTFLSNHANTYYDGTNGANIVTGQVNTIDYSSDNATLTINLSTGVGVGGTADGSAYAFTPTNGYNSINKIIASGTGIHVITGSKSDDYLIGGSNGDTLDGGLGNNTLQGGSGGYDVYTMGLGHDSIIASTGSFDVLGYNNSSVGVVVNLDNISHSFSNNNNATITVAAYSGGSRGESSADNNAYSLGDSYQAVSGTGTSIDQVSGSTYGGDVIFGGSSTLYFYSGAFNSSTSIDTLYGGTGNVFYYGAGSTVKDYFYGGSGNDVYGFSPGLDRADGGTGYNIVDASYRGSQAGYNMVVYLDGTADINANGTADYIDRGIASGGLTAGGVAYTGFELGWSNATTAGSSYTLLKNFGSILGFSGNDLLVGDNSANEINGRTGSNSLYGMGGNDIITAIDGSNYIDGGSGTDTVNFQYANSATSTTTGSYGLGAYSPNYSYGVQVFLSDANFGGTGSDQTAAWGSGLSTYQSRTGTVGGYSYSTIVNVENINGSDYADTLYGNSSANAIYGNIGDDTIAGNGGLDSLYGGGGNDTFRATSAQMSAVSVVDGGTGTDTLTVSGWTFSANDANVNKVYATEVIDVRNSTSGGTYGLSSQDVINITSTTHGGSGSTASPTTLTLKLDSGDTFTPIAGGSISSIQSGNTLGTGDNYYHVYASGTGHSYTDANYVATLVVHYGA